MGDFCGRLVLKVRMNRHRVTKNPVKAPVLMIQMETANNRFRISIHKLNTTYVVVYDLSDRLPLDSDFRNASPIFCN